MRERCHLLPLKENLTLIRARELLSKDYSFIPSALLKYNSDDDEYKNINCWNTIDEIYSFNDQIRYFQAEGTMEVRSGSLEDFNGNLKAKRFRINQINIVAVFLEIEVFPNVRKICVLIEESENQIKNVKTHLFGMRREIADKTLKEEWGINKKEDSFFKFKDDFFSWIMIQNEKNIAPENMQILDINHIYDIHSEQEREHRISGDGILNDLLSSVALILEPEFISLGILIEDTLGRFDFILSSNGSVELKESTSYLKQTNGETVPISEANKMIAYIIIYGKIIPKLINHYNIEYLNITFGNEKKDFLNKKTKEAIEKLKCLLDKKLK